jgi:hypothetical protein
MVCICLLLNTLSVAIFLWHNMSSSFAIGISAAHWLVGVVSKIWLNVLS